MSKYILALMMFFLVSCGGGSNQETKVEVSAPVATEKDYTLSIRKGETFYSDYDGSPYHQIIVSMEDINNNYNLIFYWKYTDEGYDTSKNSQDKSITIHGDYENLRYELHDYNGTIIEEGNL